MKKSRKPYMLKLELVISLVFVIINVINFPFELLGESSQTSSYSVGMLSGKVIMILVFGIFAIKRAFDVYKLTNSKGNATKT